MTYPLSVKIASARQIIKGRDNLSKHAATLSIADKAKARRVIASYRDVIFDRKSSGIDAMDALTPEASIYDISVYLESLAGASDAEKARATIYANMVRNAASNADTPIMQHFFSAHRALQTDAPPQKVLLADAYQRGAAVVADADEPVKRMKLLVADYRAENEKFSIQYKRISQEIVAPVDAASAARDAITQAARTRANGGSIESDADYLAACAAYDEAWEAYKSARALLWAERDTFEARGKAISDEISAIGAKCIANLAERSPIDEATAIQWAAGVDIDKSAQAKLKRIGYPVEQARTDMAEFYRLTGGKMPKVALVAIRGRRSKASGVSDLHGAGEILIADGFDKRVLFHEMAHHLEHDPVAKQIAGTFLDERCEPGEPVSLRSLTGNASYSSDEVAFKDGFINPYVGKYYSDGSTEVFSMGMELFSDPVALASALEVDPQHVALVAGYALSPKDTLFRAIKTSIEGADRVAEDASQQQANVEAGYLKIIDAHVTMDANASEPAQIDDWARRTWRIGKYYGKIYDFYLYDAKIARWVSGKKRLPKEKVFIQRNDRGGFHMQHLNEDCEIAKAKAHAYAIVKQGGKYPNIKEIAEELSNVH